MGATMSSETTAAAAGAVGALRFDPFAMLPFCGYNMADYFAHWLKVGRRDGAKLPKVFYVNWFRKDDDGKFLWPGFGENSRVLAYVFRRCNGEGETVETPIGLVPAPGELDTDGLDLSDEALQALLTVDEDKLKAEIEQVKEHLAKFGDDLPAEVSRAAREARGALADPRIPPLRPDGRGGVHSARRSGMMGDREPRAPNRELSAGGPAAGADRRAGAPGPRASGPGVRPRLPAAARRRRQLGGHRARGAARPRSCRCSSSPARATATRSRCARSTRRARSTATSRSARCWRPTPTTCRSWSTPSRASSASRGLQVPRLLHPIVATERDGRRPHPRRARPARRDAPRVGHALRPRPAARPTTSWPSSRTRSAATLIAVRAVVRDFPAMLERAAGMTKLARAGAVALRGRRGRGGRRLPRLAAARRVRVPRRARVRLQPRRASRSSTARAWASSPTRRSPRSRGRAA